MLEAFFVWKMAKKRVSPKALQYLMGHAEIGITLDVYTTLTDIDVEEELREIEARDVGVETGDDYKSDIIKFDDRRQKVDYYNQYYYTDFNIR